MAGRAAVIGIKRSLPRRSPRRYPVGTSLTLRDGRVFEVVELREKFWDDPSLGCGGGMWAWRTIKEWKELL